MILDRKLFFSTTKSDETVDFFDTVNNALLKKKLLWLKFFFSVYDFREILNQIKQKIYRKTRDEFQIYSLLAMKIVERQKWLFSPLYPATTK